jgi:hypothetical protein
MSALGQKWTLRLVRLVSALQKKTFCVAVNDVVLAPLAPKETNPDMKRGQGFGWERIYWRGG